MALLSPAGKDAARRELRKRLRLADVDVPVVGCVTRLVAQKVGGWPCMYKAHAFCVCVAGGPNLRRLAMPC